MIKEIPLTQGKIALVDDIDFDFLNAFDWYAVKQQHENWYAVRKQKSVLGFRKVIWMHREIMRASKGVEVDHINGSGLDNRRENLRTADDSENARNRRRQSASKSGYKGVSWENGKRLWRAQIEVNKRNKHVGYFRNKEDAARAYDAAATKYFGEFAWVNFPKDKETG